MAVRYAVATGNWSDVTTWDGGASLPTIGDDVYANGFIVTMNITPITVTKLSTEVCPITSVGGGRFAGSATANTIIGNIVAGSTICVYFTAPTGFVIGNVYGGSSTDAYGIRCQNFSGVTVTGNIYGGSAANTFGIYTYYGYDITIVGNVEGGSVSTATGIYGKLATGGKILSITGVVEGKTANAVSIDNSNWEIRIVGTLKSNTGLAIYGSAPSGMLLQITGNLISSANSIPFVGYYNVKLTAGSSSVFKMYDTDGTEVYYYTSNVLENPPAESDTRSGVVYGIGSNYTGKMVVPIEGHVIQGVEYDVNKIGQLPVAQTINSQDVTDIMSDIANIETKIDNVDNKIDNVDNKIDTIDTSINTVNNNISNMNIDINTIENELDTAITNINTIDGKVDVIDGKIDTLPTDTLNELKQDDLGERLSKVGTIEEMTNIIINS